MASFGNQTHPKKEQIANLPFSCDGCLRILPKLNEMGSIISKQQQQLETYETKINDLESSIDKKIEKQVEKAIDMYIEREKKENAMLSYTTYLSLLLKIKNKRMN